MGMFSKLEGEPAKPAAAEGPHDDDAAGGKPGKDGKPDPTEKKDSSKTTVLVLLSIVGVVIAWISYKHQVTAAASAGGADTTSPAYGGGVGGTGTVAGSTDSGGDASSGFASYLANLSGEISTLQGQVAALPTTTTPVTTPTSPSKPAAPKFDFLNYKKDTYIRDQSSGAIYQVQAGTGTQIHLTPAQWAAVSGNGAKISSTFGVAPKSAPAKAAPKTPAKK